MLKVFETKRNSNYKRTQHFNQIYEKSTSSFVALMPVFSDGFFNLIFKPSKKQSSGQFSILSITFTLFVTVVLICFNTFWLVKVTMQRTECKGRNSRLFKISWILWILLSCMQCRLYCKTDWNLDTRIKNIVGWIKIYQYLIILQSVTCTSTPLPYIVFHAMVMCL